MTVGIGNRPVEVVSVGVDKPLPRRSSRGVTKTSPGLAKQTIVRGDPRGDEWRLQRS